MAATISKCRVHRPSGGLVEHRKLLRSEIETDVLASSHRDICRQTRAHHAAWCRERHDLRRSEIFRTKDLPRHLTGVTQADVLWPNAEQKVTLVKVLVDLGHRDRGTAEDALELIAVDYDPLRPVVDVREAIKPSSATLFDELGSNLAWHGALSYGDIDGAFVIFDLFA